jgi:tRNA nucleotidyltransferase (CCA-adding enzyme)
MMEGKQKETNIIFEEITEHLMNDEHPSEYIQKLAVSEAFREYPFSMLVKLKATEQSKQHHPEGNVWNHTMMVVDQAAMVRNQCKEAKVFMWAALLHDIGKPDTTKNRKGRITSYDHDKVGEKLCINFLRVMTEDEVFIQEVAALVRYHMHMLYVLKELPFREERLMLQRVDLQEIALLCRCDRLGRTGADREKEELQYLEFIKKMNKISGN